MECFTVLFCIEATVDNINDVEYADIVDSCDVELEVKVILEAVFEDSFEIDCVDTVAVDVDDDDSNCEGDIDDDRDPPVDSCIPGDDFDVAVFTDADDINVDINVEIDVFEVDIADIVFDVFDSSNIDVVVGVDVGIVFIVEFNATANDVEAAVELNNCVDVVFETEFKIIDTVAVGSDDNTDIVTDDVDAVAVESDGNTDLVTDDVDAVVVESDDNTDIVTDDVDPVAVESDDNTDIVTDDVDAVAVESDDNSDIVTDDVDNDTDGNTIVGIVVEICAEDRDVEFESEVKLNRSVDA